MSYNCVVCTRPMDEVDDYTHICQRCRRVEYTWHGIADAVGDVFADEVDQA